MRIVSLLPSATETVDALGLSDWADLPAVRAGRVYLVDGRICSRHGPRVVDAIEPLTRLLHPGVLPGTVPPDQGLSWRQAYGEGA